LIYKATTEVVSAITTALATTVVSFLPVFALESAEAKLFHPLAFTKTFALAASFFIGIIILPALAHYVFSVRLDSKRTRRIWNIVIIAAGIVLAIAYQMVLPIALVLIGLNNLLEDRWPVDKRSIPSYINIGIVLVVTSFFLTEEWAPLGHNVSMFVNYLFVLLMVGLILGALMLMVRYYEPLLRWCLVNKGKFLLIPVFTILLGVVAWLGFDKVFGFIPKAFDVVGTNLRTTSAWSAMIHTFPGMGKEFMPSMDEGTF